MTRQEMGLPEIGFIFCCFNANHKISPREFDIWMRLLHQVKGSVLWLKQSNQWAKSNLMKETKMRGIDPSRLIFSKTIKLEDHLARHKLADIFLDTFNFNAHSTASDALWAGLPVITRIGEQFVARVASSLLNALGLPELIATNDYEYEALALELATNKSLLKSTKKKLLHNKHSTPLFDTKSYTKNYEEGLEKAFNLYKECKKPEDIWVQDRV